MLHVAWLVQENGKLHHTCRHVRACIKQLPHIITDCRSNLKAYVSNDRRQLWPNCGELHAQLPDENSHYGKYIGVLNIRLKISLYVYADVAVGHGVSS